jgi:hypothetical protein
MSGVYIESAYYGDEKSFANITKSLANKIFAGVLDVTASAELKPTFEAAPETTLNTRDERKIRDQAVAACGGEADQACLDRMRLKLSQERLKEKENESLGKGVIKGDRLTVNIIDNGRRRTLITPAGQKFKLENVVGNRPDDKTMQLPTASDIQDRAIALLTIILSTFVWVFGIVAAYAIFMRQYENTGKDYFRIVAYAAAGLALLFPGAGYIIILLYFGFQTFIAEYIAQ